MLKKTKEFIQRILLSLTLFIQLAPVWAKPIMIDPGTDGTTGANGGTTTTVTVPDEVIKYDIFSQWFGLNPETMTPLNFFAMLTKYCYWGIFGAGVLMCFWKILQAGYIIVQKNSAGAPDWMTIDLKMELWDPIKGLVILDLGLLIIGIIMKMASSMGMFTGNVATFISLVF